MTAARRPTGFATIVAVMMIAFVGIALTTVTSLFAAEVRRTRGQQEEAQLRQLLLAGAEIARGATGAGADGSVPLPQELLPQGASLSIRPEGEAGGRRQVAITAAVGQRRATQVVTLAAEGASWRIVAAELRGSR